MNNLHSILNLNRNIVSAIDDKIRRLDDSFIWNISQIDEETMHAICRREMFEKSKLSIIFGFLDLKT